jgi:hypothetical protein
VNTGKPRGFSLRLPGSGQVDLVDPGWLDLDPLDLDLAAAVVCGRRGQRD